MRDDVFRFLSVGGSEMTHLLLGKDQKDHVVCVGVLIQRQEGMVIHRFMTTIGTT